MKYDLSKPFDVAKFDTYSNKLKIAGKKVELIEKRKREIQQNDLFHMWVAVYADFIGDYDYKACKRDIKRHLLGTYERLSKITGKIEYDDFETSKMNVKEMSDFMDKFKIWAQMGGCYLPYYKDAGYDEMMEQYSRYRR